MMCLAKSQEYGVVLRPRPKHFSKRSTKHAPLMTVSWLNALNFSVTSSSSSTSLLKPVVRLARPFACSKRKTVSTRSWVLCSSRFHLNWRSRDDDSGWLQLEVLEEAESISSEATTLKASLQWTGSIIKMETFRILRQLLHGELSRGRKNQVRLRKRSVDCLNSNVVHVEIPTQ